MLCYATICANVLLTCKTLFLLQWRLQVPPPSRGSLYLRPLLLGTGPLLGLCPAPSYTFVLYAVPVGGRAKVRNSYLVRSLPWAFAWWRSQILSSGPSPWRMLR